MAAHRCQLHPESREPLVRRLLKLATTDRLHLHRPHHTVRSHAIDDNAPGNDLITAAVLTARGRNRAFAA